MIINWSSGLVKVGEASGRLSAGRASGEERNGLV